MFGFGLLGEEFFGLVLGDFLGVGIFRDADVVAAAGTFDVGAVGAD